MASDDGAAPAPASSTTEIDLDQDLPFQYWSWRVQKVIWGLLAFVILLATLGLFGPGPLSHATAGGTEKGLWVEYDRFARFQAPTIMKLHLSRQPNMPTRAQVWISKAFLEAGRLDRISPEPLAVAAESDRQVYTFLLGEPGEHNTVRLFFFPEQTGTIVCRMGLEGEPHLGFTQFVFP